MEGKKSTNWQFLKKLNTDLPYDPAISILGAYSGGLKHVYGHTKTHT